MQMVWKNLSIIVIWVVHIQALGSGNRRLFGYESGKCQTSISSVLKAMVKTELKILLNTVPNLPQSKLLQYDLYTRLNPYERQSLRLDDVEALRNTHFNAKWPVRISIHGWGGCSSSCSNAAIKDAYLSRGNFNVIIMNWNHQASDPNYSRVSKKFKSIANSLAKFIKFLHEKTGMPFESVYLIGHSAGSHISGLTGKFLRPQRLGAIFALDPAGLVQLRLGPNKRLAPNDAIYVESIHSDVTLLGNPRDNLSQASFFANWGLGQPNCPNATATEFDFVCDHYAALYYFAESVRHPKLFGAVRCNSVESIKAASCRCAGGSPSTTLCNADEFMGGEPAVAKKGVYYFSTQRHVPFGYSDGLVHIKKPKPSTVTELRPLAHQN